MRRKLNKGPSGASVDLTPMLDIVFIMLIFFIVTSTFLAERGVDMAPKPSDDQTQNIEVKSILIQIDAADSVYINRKFVPDIGLITANVQRYNVENGGKSTVVITSHIDSHHGVVTKVNDAVRATGLAVSIQKPSADIALGGGG